MGSVDRIEHERGLSTAFDVTGFLAQNVQRCPFVVEYLQDRFLRESVDARARRAIGPAAHDFGGIPPKRFDRVLNGVREFQEESLHRATYRLSSYRIMARRRAKARLRVLQGREDSARNFPTGHGEDENGEGKPAGATDRAQPRGRNDVREDQEDGDSRHDKSDRCGRENRILESEVFGSNGGRRGSMAIVGPEVRKRDYHPEISGIKRLSADDDGSKEQGGPAYE